ncbi:foldase protein PrsA [Faecalicoccus acidiformans]|uniref:Foldase protein PrsA n=1 Tax=Faecalicoccus acidiformans TaxID=915173 RepID=A0A7W8D019_9FIRM|nr:hypothetical protein [Faecalicoccus acidiformans]MBB5184770.1 foldase protein PrsA [Faecalicoccus acidiformans]
MKANKVKGLLVIGCTCMLIGGCSNSATINNASDVLFTVGETTVTRGDEYDLVKNANGSTLTIELVRQAIMDEEIGRTEEIQKEAEEQYESNASSVDNYEESLKEAGYKDKDDYIEKVIIPTIQQEKLLDQYFTDAKEEITKTYKPTIAKILECDTREDAKNALSALQDGKDEATVWDTYSRESANFSNEEIVVSTLMEETLPTYVINTLYSQDEAGIVDEVMTDDESEDGPYYVAILVSKDYDENKEKIQENLTLRNSDQIDNDCLVYYMKKHNLEFHDQEIFDSIRSTNPEYIVNHPELAEEEGQ